MEDYLIRGISHNGHIQAFGALSTNLVNQAVAHHDLWPVATAALGRTMTVTAMMASRMKEENGKIEVSIDGQGPLGKILVQAKPNGCVKGYVDNPHVNYELYPGGGLNVGKAVGTDGSLKVTKDIGLKQPFVGDVALKTGEIGDDFAYYFMQSEQTPSIVSLGVLIDTDNSVKAAGGLVIQLMPGHTEEDIVYLENALSKMRPISSLLDEGKTCKEILDELFTDYKFMDDHDVRFVCDCSKQRFRAALTTIKLEDLIDLYEKDKHIEVKCEYCNKKYEFDEDELNTIITYVQNQRLGN